jgi:hypothetical protein
LLQAGCGSNEAEAPRPPAEAVELTPLPPAPDPALVARLRESVVHHDRVWRRVLFTWTTQDQLADLRAERVLLFRSESPERGPAYFDQVVAARADAEAPPDPVARLLREPGLAARRFAWPSPWATLSGWDGESYGDRLIRVELRDDAVVARFDPTAAEEPWRFVDRHEAVVGLEDVVRDPSRLAAVYHVAASTPERAAYREYVLVNESMIARWSITPGETRSEIDRGVSLLADLTARIRTVPPADAGPTAEWARRVTSEVWPLTDDDAPVERSWEACLAFPNERHRLDEATLGRIAAALRAVPIPDRAVESRPRRDFELRPARPRVTAPRMRARPGGLGTFIRGTF